MLYNVAAGLDVADVVEAGTVCCRSKWPLFEEDGGGGKIGCTVSFNCSKSYSNVFPPLSRYDFSCIFFFFYSRKLIARKKKKKYSKRHYVLSCSQKNRQRGHSRTDRPRLARVVPVLFYPSDVFPVATNSIRTVDPTNRR